MKKILPYGLILILMQSCYIFNSPTKSKELYGNIKTCILDSTAILNETLILIKLKGEKDINAACIKKDSVIYEAVQWWPSWISFDFKTKDFFYVCNPKQAKEDKNSFSYEDGEGFIKYNRKKKILTMIIAEYNWAKDFSVLYNKKEQTVKLTVLKNNSAALEEFKNKKTKRSDSQVKILNERQ